MATTRYDPFSGTLLAPRCYESHPVVKIGKGKLYGGSARHPKITNANVYVVLQTGDMDGRQSDPWDQQMVIEVQYAIHDMEAPSNVTRFKKLVTWVCNQLHDGKTVHVGCIGGHGRTGTVLSAIVAEALGEKEAIQWVRKHYCKKAVESKAQVAFLMKHYGVTTATPTKSTERVTTGLWKPSSEGPVSAGYTRDDWQQSRSSAPPQTNGKLVRRVVPEGLTASTKSFAPMQASARSLWKRG